MRKLRELAVKAMRPKISREEIQEKMKAAYAVNGQVRPPYTPEVEQKSFSLGNNTVRLSGYQIHIHIIIILRPEQSFSQPISNNYAHTLLQMAALQPRFIQQQRDSQMKKVELNFVENDTDDKTVLFKQVGRAFMRVDRTKYVDQSKKKIQK